MAKAKKTTSKKKPSSVSFKAEISDDLKKEIKNCCKDGNCNHKSTAHSSTFGFTYFLGFIGAAVYYISTATGFWMGLLGVIKAVVWPAFLVFELMKFIGM